MTSKKHRRPAWRPNPQISHARRATLAATAMALGAAVPAYAQEKDDRSSKIGPDFPVVDFQLRVGEFSKISYSPFQARVADMPVVDAQVPGVSAVG